MATWWTVVVVILLLGVGLMVYFARNKGADPQATEGLKAAKVTRIVALLVAMTFAVGGLSTSFATLWGPDVTVQLPVEQFWPAIPAGVDLQTPLATVVAGGFTQATVSVNGLDTPARLWLAGAALLQALVGVTAGLIIARLCTAVLQRTLFGPQLIRGLRQVAGVVLLGGLGWQACQIVGGTLASEQVLGATSWSIDQATVGADWTDLHQIMGLPSVVTSWEVNFWPIGGALAIFVLAELFRQGNKVQKEVAGLI